MYGLKMITLLPLLGLLPACAQFGKGVAEAVLEREKEDTRACHVEGPATAGLAALMDEQERERQTSPTDRQLKVLMVHGIGRHIPGYSGRLTEHLMPALGLAIREKTIKEIVLRDPTVTDDRLGVLNVSRYTNKARTRTLLFYELTWSEITEPAKQAIAFDESGEWAFRRSGLNQWGKSFFNNHIPDLLIYLGEAYLPILASARQSLCWMTMADWGDYADEAHASCDVLDQSRIKQIKVDDYAIVSHSLGSRIVMDMLEYATIDTAGKAEFRPIQDIFREKSLPIFMLANQLPLLELGRAPAGITGEVIGGSGRWEGAGGTITMRRVTQSENGGSVEFEIHMTIP